LEEERKNLSKELINNAKVVFTTSAQVYSNSEFQEYSCFDVIIVDEASMMSVPTLAVIGARASSQIIVVGDFCQLAPIACSESSNYYDYLHKSLFEHHKMNKIEISDALSMLKYQRRMHPLISHVISSHFYSKKLQDSKDLEESKVNLPTKNLNERNLFWDISNSIHRRNIEYETKFTKNKSRYNVGSAYLITELVEKLKDMNIDKSIAVISTYKEQVYQLKKCFDKYSAADVHVGTVHTFQGSEANIIIWDLVDTSETNFGIPYSENSGDRLTNVAISRAKDLIIIVGDRSLIHNTNTQTNVNKLTKILREIYDATNEIDSWVNSDDIMFEESLFFD